MLGELGGVGGKVDTREEAVCVCVCVCVWCVCVVCVWVCMCVHTDVH